MVKPTETEYFHNLTSDPDDYREFKRLTGYIIDEVRKYNGEPKSIKLHCKPRPNAWKALKLALGEYWRVSVAQYEPEYIIVVSERQK